MPNKPRPENRHRMVRVEDDLWNDAREAADAEGTTRAEVMRQALRELVKRNQGEAMRETVPDVETGADWPCRTCGESAYFDGDGHAEHRDGMGSHVAVVRA